MPSRLEDTIQGLARVLARAVLDAVCGASLGEAADWLGAAAAPRGSTEGSSVDARTGRRAANAPIHQRAVEGTARTPPRTPGRSQGELELRSTSVSGQRDEDLVARVRALLPELLESGDHGLEAVAPRLGIGARMLQRRLLEQGATYASLVAAIQRDRAEREVGVGDKSFGEIASLLGFSQASAFSRAFHRWTGVSPREYRLARQPPEPAKAPSRSPERPAPARTRPRAPRPPKADPEQVLDRLVDLLREQPTGIRADELRAKLRSSQVVAEAPLGEAHRRMHEGTR